MGGRKNVRYWANCRVSILSPPLRKGEKMTNLTLGARGLLGGSELVTAQHLPRGTATDVTNAEVQATVQKTASAPVSDQAIRVVSINDEYNVGIGVVHRAKTAGRSAGGAIEHSQITEVYHVIEGNATLVTGGGV